MDRQTAGRSAAAWATATRRGRPWWRRLIAALGWWPDREADRRDAGAVGERLTASLLAPLARSGYRILHDLALPGTRANVDHVIVLPHGRYVLVVDSKLWSARWRVRTVSGRLHHGSQDRQRCVEALVEAETRRVAQLLGVPAVPLIAVHRAPVDGGGFDVAHDGQAVRVIPAGRLAETVRWHASRHRHDPPAARALAARAARNLAAYR